MGKRLTDTVVKRHSSGRLTDTELRGLFIVHRKTGVFFYLEYSSPVTGKQRKAPLGKFGEITTTEARRKASELKGQIAKGIDPQEEKQAQKAYYDRQQQETLKAFLHGAYKEVTAVKTAATEIRNIESNFPDYLDKPMSSITAFSLEKWKRSYSGKPSAANRYLTSLRGALSKAVKAGIIDSHPMSDVKKLREDKSQKVRYLTTDEESRLMAAIEARQDDLRAKRLRFISHCLKRHREAPEPLNGAYADHIKPMVVIAINTGLRKGELFRVKAADIDLPARLITVRGEISKSSQTRQIPLNDVAFQTLVTWLNQTGNRDLVFPSPATGGTFDNISTSWEDIRGRSGLSEVRFHDLRHTFGTRLAQNRVDLVTIKELMGHESLDTTARYLHTNDELKLQAVAGL